MIKFMFIFAFTLFFGVTLSIGYTKSIESIGLLKQVKNLIAEDDKLRKELRRIADKNIVLTSKLQQLESSINKTDQRTRNFSRSNCREIDSGEIGGQLWCPAGYYVAGAKNLYNSNQVLDMLVCCSPN